MLRFEFALVAVALAAGAAGCTQCDTCDDFPLPCANGNCGGMPVSANAGYTQVPVAGNSEAPTPPPMPMATAAPTTPPAPMAMEPGAAAPVSLSASAESAPRF